MPVQPIEDRVQLKMSMAFQNIDTYLRSILEKLHREEGILVSDAFNMETMNNLWQSLRVQMESLGYRDAVLEQLTGLEQLHYEIQQEAGQLGLPEQFSQKSQQMISILIQGADSELTQVANQANEAVGQILRRAAMGGVDFSDMLIDIQKKLNVHRAQAQTLITTTLHSFNSHMLVSHATEVGIKWFVYLGPLDEVTREWCEQWVERRGTLEMFEATSKMWGRQSQPGGIAAWRGGWNCRHHLTPLVGNAIKKYPIGPEDPGVRAAIMSELGISGSAFSQKAIPESTVASHRTPTTQSSTLMQIDTEMDRVDTDLERARKERDSAVATNRAVLREARALYRQIKDVPGMEEKARMLAERIKQLERDIRQLKRL